MSRQLVENESDIDRRDRRSHVSLMNGALVTGGAMVFRQGSAILISILVARALGASGKGEMALLSQYVSVAAMLMGLGLEGAHAYFVGRRGRSPEAVVADTLMFVCAVSLVGVPALALFLGGFVPALGEISTYTLAIASLSVVPILLTSLVGGVLVGEGRIKEQAAVSLLASGVTLACVAAATALGRLSVGVAVGSAFAGVTAGALAVLWLSGVRRMCAPSVRRLGDEVSYAWKSYMQSVAGYLELRQDILLLGFMATTQAVGVYSVGVALAEMIMFVPQAVYSSLLSRAFAEEQEGGAELTVRVTRLLFVFSSLTAIVLAALAKPLVAIVFGAQFADASAVYLLLIPGMLSWALYSQVQGFFASHGRLFPGLGVAALLLNLALNVAFIPRWGIYGAAVATSVSYAVGNGYVVVAFLRSTGFGPLDLLWVRRADVDLLWSSLRARFGWLR